MESLPPNKEGMDEARRKAELDLRNAQRILANKEFQELFIPRLQAIIDRERRDCEKRHNLQHEESAARLELAEEIANILPNIVKTVPKFLESK